VVSQGRKRELWTQVAERDGYRCVLCNQPSTGGAHHILSRSQLVGPSNEALLWRVENLCRLCEPCHRNAPGKRGELLVLLKERYGYSYEDEPFASYVDIAEGGVG